jgi:hypothetical protein
MANIRLYQNFASAGDFEKNPKKSPVRRVLSGKAKTVIEPTFSSMFGKNVDMKINGFFVQAVEIAKTDKDGKDILEEKDFNFCSLSFRNCQREHFLVVNKTFELCLVENGLAEYDEQENTVLYDFDELIGKVINGYVYCDMNGKGKKLFGKLSSMEQYISYLKELEEKQAEENKAELKE